jgi:hypothetical protein
MSEATATRGMRASEGVVNTTFTPTPDGGWNHRVAYQDAEQVYSESTAIQLKDSKVEKQKEELYELAWELDAAKDDTEITQKYVVLMKRGHQWEIDRLETQLRVACEDNDQLKARLISERRIVTHVRPTVEATMEAPPAKKQHTASELSTDYMDSAERVAQLRYEAVKGTRIDTTPSAEWTDALVQASIDNGVTPELRAITSIDYELNRVDTVCLKKYRCKFASGAELWLWKALVERTYPDATAEFNRTWSPLDYPFCEWNCAMIRGYLDTPVQH